MVAETFVGDVAEAGISVAVVPETAVGEFWAANKLFPELKSPGMVVEVEELDDICVCLPDILYF